MFIYWLLWLISNLLFLYVIIMEKLHVDAKIWDVWRSSDKNQEMFCVKTMVLGLSLLDDQKLWHQFSQNLFSSGYFHSMMVWSSQFLFSNWYFLISILNHNYCIWWVKNVSPCTVSPFILLSIHIDGDSIVCFDR